MWTLNGTVKVLWVKTKSYFAIGFSDTYTRINPIGWLLDLAQDTFFVRESNSSLRGP